MAEWLRRWIANPLDFVRACSNHADVDFSLFCSFASIGSGVILVVMVFIHLRPSSGFTLNDQTLTVKILSHLCPDCVLVDNGEVRGTVTVPPFFLMCHS